MYLYGLFKTFYKLGYESRNQECIVEIHDFRISTNTKYPIKCSKTMDI